MVRCLPTNQVNFNITKFSYNRSIVIKHNSSIKIAYKYHARQTNNILKVIVYQRKLKFPEMLPSRTLFVSIVLHSRVYQVKGHMRWCKVKARSDLSMKL